MSDDLIGKVDDWIRSQGYPFEMYVAKIFKEAGFSIGQSLYYLDDEIGREVDIIAFNSMQIKDTAFSIAFVIECKTNRNKPWVAFKANFQLKDKDVINSIQTTRKGQKLVDLMLLDDRYKQFSFLTIDNQNTCYTLSLALTNGNEVVYGIQHHLSKCINYYIDKFNEASRPMNVVQTAYMYFPCIAIDAKFFSCEMTDDVLEINEANQIKYVSRKHSNNQLYTTIDIVTKDCIKSFAENLYKETELFFKVYREEMEKVDEIRNSYYDW